MKNIYDFDYNNKKVILRCDLNVSIKDNKIIDNQKIVSSLDTIKYLINQNAKIIIMSHLGRIKTIEDEQSNSLFIVYNELVKLIPETQILFSPQTHGEGLEKMIQNLSPKDILLIENTRFEDLDGEKESKCDEELSKYWASLGDIFINDAFGLSHRQHASNYGISKYLPTGIGFLMEKEIKGLDIVINPEHPFVVIMGGAKIEDKIELINDILTKCNYLLVGGAIANTFLQLKYNVGKSLVNNNVLPKVDNLLKKYPNKIILPNDVIVLDKNNEPVIRSINSINEFDTIYDIGPNTIKGFTTYIDNAKTVFLNGTVGKYEDNHFEIGTKTILYNISVSKAKTVIGGGDALSSADYFKINNFTFISTGGGATLDYIGSGKLKCFENE